MLLAASIHVREMVHSLGARQREHSQPYNRGNPVIGAIRPLRLLIPSMDALAWLSGSSLRAWLPRIGKLYRDGVEKRAARTKKCGLFCILRPEILFVDVPGTILVLFIRHGHCGSLSASDP